VKRESRSSVYKLKRERERERELGSNEEGVRVGVV